MKTAFTVAFVVAFTVVLLSTAGCTTTGSNTGSTDNSVELEQSQSTDKTLSALIDILGAWYLDCH